MASVLQELRRGKTIGIGRTPDVWKTELAKRRVRLGNHARLLLDSPGFVSAPAGTTIQVRLRTWPELGITTAPTFDTVLEKGMGEGLALLPHEGLFGVALEISSIDYLVSNPIEAVMETFRFEEDDNDYRFRLEEDSSGGRRWLTGLQGRPDARYHDDRILFAFAEKIPSAPDAST